MVHVMNNVEEEVVSKETIKKIEMYIRKSKEILKNEFPTRIDSPELVLMIAKLLQTESHWID